MSVDLTEMMRCPPPPAESGNDVLGGGDPRWYAVTHTHTHQRQTSGNTPQLTGEVVCVRERETEGKRGKQRKREKERKRERKSD